MRSEGEKKAEEYRTGGLVAGVVGLVCVVLVAGVGLADPRLDFPVWGVALAVVVMVGVWALMIRPCVRLEPTEVHLRNVFHDRWIPYAAIDGIKINQVTRVMVGDTEIIGSGLGRSRRDIRLDAKVEKDVDHAVHHSVGWLVEERIRRRVRDAPPLDGDAADAVRHEWAWPVIGALAGPALLTVVLLLLGV